jgi:hypothetical protein
MVTMLDLINDGGELASMVAAQAGAEDLGNLVGGQPPQTKFAASLEQLMDGKVAFEYVVEAIFHLTDGIGAGQLNLSAFLGGELRAEDKGPIIKPFADNVRAQLIGRRLQRCDVVNGQKRIVILAETDIRLVELVLDEAVAVEVVRCLEGEE